MPSIRLQYAQYTGSMPSILKYAEYWQFAQYTGSMPSILEVCSVHWQYAEYTLTTYAACLNF